MLIVRFIPLNGIKYVFKRLCHVLSDLSIPIPSDLCVSRLQPECQDVEEGGGLIGSLSSCICSLIGRRRPQETLSSPSTISSPSSYVKEKTS